ncbi:unnamed protein product [Amoebophrya sp. A120]|nr:unnamed protein product [Amoebophrya sp. A120]|eukprot:GSA120T00024581001.1
MITRENSPSKIREKTKRSSNKGPPLELIAAEMDEVPLLGGTISSKAAGRGDRGEENENQNSSSYAINQEQQVLDSQFLMLPADPLAQVKERAAHSLSSSKMHAEFSAPTDLQGVAQLRPILTSAERDRGAIIDPWRVAELKVLLRIVIQI